MTSIFVVPRREPVVRSLFGPVDHEQLRRELKHRLRELSAQDSRRWNFDFREETPLPGRFAWEELPAERTAAFYREPRESRACAPATPLKREGEEDGGDGGDEGDGGREESTRPDQENCARSCNTKHPAEVTPGRRKRSRSKSATPRARDNTRITDFFTKRRRSSDSKMALTSVSSEPAQCKTIR